MAGITAAMVKDLRDKTGAGMMDCKQALNETGGDAEAAIDWLRTKGLSKAAKKAGRVAADGLVGVCVSDDGKSAAVVEVNAETDFVARNDQFQELVTMAASLALDAKGDLETMLKAKVPGKAVALSEHVSNLIATIGENMSIRRCNFLSVSEGAVAAYVHNQVARGVGKIGVMVALESGGDAEVLGALGKQLAMHIAAANPVALNKDSVDPALVERERTIFMEQARESGKPEDIIAKMVEGRLRKYFEEVALLSQTFVIDNETKVDKVVANTAKEIGAPITVTGFARFELGEGIEKEKEDFAAEVAAVASN